MRGVLTAGALIGAAMLGGFAPAGATAFDFWKTGDGILSYHRLEGDCEALTHSFGRNAAWGRWILPLAEVEVEMAPAAAGQTGASLTFTCRAGSDCIRAGALATTDRRLSRRLLPFGSVERAAMFETAIADLRKTCDARRPL